MPCYITGTEIGDLRLSYDELLKESQHVTRLLCCLCRNADAAKQQLPISVSIWWKRHKKQDKESQ